MKYLHFHRGFTSKTRREKPHFLTFINTFWAPPKAKGHTRKTYTQTIQHNKPLNKNHLHLVTHFLLQSVLHCFRENASRKQKVSKANTIRIQVKYYSYISQIPPERTVLVL